MAKPALLIDSDDTAYKANQIIDGAIDLKANVHEALLILVGARVMAAEDDGTSLNRCFLKEIK